MNHSVFTIKSSQIGESGESCKSEYDLSKGCPYCGTGAKLIGQLRVKGIKKPKDLLETLNGDYLISTRIYQKIQKEIPQFSLNMVANINGDKLDYYHFYSDYILPRFNNKSTGYKKEDGCVHCVRNGFFNDAIIASPEHNYNTFLKPLHFVYNEKDFDKYKDKDILLTWECVGLSNLVAFGNKVIRYARPWLIVSDRLQNVLKSLDIPNLNFEPIIIENNVA